MYFRMFLLSVPTLVLLTSFKKLKLTELKIITAVSFKVSLETGPFNRGFSKSD